MASRSRPRGIISYGTYVPFRRLDRASIVPVAGRGGGKGTRAVASYDEDTTTLGVEAARAALVPLRDPAYRAERGLPAQAGEPIGAAPPGRPQTGSGHEPGALWFATTTPAYADKTNATAIHAALRLDPAAPAFDACGSVRSAVGALRAALAGAGTGTGTGGGSAGGATGSAGAPALVVTADVRTGLPGSADEAAGGDAAAALVVGEEDDDRPFLAEVLGWGSVTDEFLDRWRAPGASHAQVWEERFGEGRYVAAGQRAFADALKDAGLVADQLDHVVVIGSHARACTRLRRDLGLGAAAGAQGEAWLLGAVGFTGAAHLGLALAAVLDEAGPGQEVALVVLADGADVVVLRTTEDVLAWRQPRPLTAQVDAGGPVAYGTYLAWRGLLPVDPPRRPEPARPSAPAAHRSVDWKFGFVGSQDDTGTVHLPPSPLDGTDRPMADAAGTIATFTVDRMAYSPSPPVVFAVVDFDGGGRLPVELTDVEVDDVRIGGRVELTFRKLFTADGVHNYFWKARPLRGGAPAPVSGPATAGQGQGG